MTVKLTIIGLGQVGGSIGLALAQSKNKISIVGHDKEMGIERAALKKGAIETAEHNLPRAVQGAQVVILAVPVHQVRETLEFIAPDLQEGAVVVDTSPIKSEVVKWAKEILPAGRYYMGMTPTIGAGFLQGTETGLDSARADLFSKSIFLLDVAPGAPSEAVQLMMDLVQLLGATFMLTDTTESDGLMASAYLLPQLISAALLNATVDQPGWQEGRKLAGRAYTVVTSGLIAQDDPDALRMLSMHNRENVTHALDVMIASLSAMRDEIEAGDEESVKARLKAAHKGREHWLNERLSGIWDDLKKEPAEYPTLGEKLLGGIIGRRPKKK